MLTNRLSKHNERGSERWDELDWTDASVLFLELTLQRHVGFFEELLAVLVVLLLFYLRVERELCACAHAQRRADISLQ